MARTPAHMDPPSLRGLPSQKSRGTSENDILPLPAPTQRFGPHYPSHLSQAIYRNKPYLRPRSRGEWDLAWLDGLLCVLWGRHLL